MSLPKLNLNNLITIVLVFCGFILMVIVINTIMSSTQKALTLDEKVSKTTAVAINRQNLEKAVTLLTMPETRNPTPTPAPTPTPVEAVDVSTINIRIENGSGVNGAAQAASKLFTGSPQIELKNSEQLLDETLLIYNNEYASLVPGWVSELQKLGWKSVKTEVRAEESDLDVEIKLGRSRD